MKLRVDKYRKSTDLYEVYLTKKMSNGEEIDVECVHCDCNGRIDSIESMVWLFEELRPALFNKRERKFFPQFYERIEKQLAEAIREYNLEDSNFEEPWKAIALNVKEQL